MTKLPPFEAIGLDRWLPDRGYQRRNRVETKMHCVKLWRQRLMARDFEPQVAEFQVRLAILNGFTALGIPVAKVVG
jgi:DNA repair photolyase